jgi:hypothetical protein
LRRFARLLYPYAVTAPVLPSVAIADQDLRRTDATRKSLSAGTDQKRDDAVAAFVTVCCAVFLYADAFRLPWTPRAAFGDQAIYLFDATRMFDGQVIYRNFDHFTFPGTSGFYFILFRIFGVQAWIPQAMLVVVGTLTAWLSFRICRKLMTGPSVFLPGLAFLILPFTGYLDASHHWYSTLAATAALAVLIEKRTPRRLACAGTLWGLATCFAQSMIMGLLGVAAFLVWEATCRRNSWVALLKGEASLFGSYATTVVILDGYVAWKVGFERFFAETIVFVLKYYPADRFNSWMAYFAYRPSLDHFQWLELPAWFLIHLILPLVYVLVFIRYQKESRKPHGQPGWANPEALVLVATVGVSMLLTVASAATSARLYTVSLPGLILLTWFLDSSASVQRRFLLGGFWGLVLALGILKPCVTQMKLSEHLDLPTGRTAFINEASYQKMKWLLPRVRPSDYFFGDPAMGLALRLWNPGRVDFVRPTDYTRPEQVADLIGGLEAHKVRFISWYPALDHQSGDRGDHLGPLRQYLQSRYRVAARFTNGDKIWERNP